MLFRDKRRAERQQRSRGGLARYFLSLLLPLALFPLLTFAFFAYQQARSDLQTQALTQLDTVAILKENQIEQWRIAHRQDIDNLARAPDVVEHVAALVELGEPTLTAGLTERFENYLVQNQDFQSLVLIDAETGSVLVATARVANLMNLSFLDTPYFVRARQESLVAAPRYDPSLDSNQISIIAAAPVNDPRKGVVAVIYGILRAEQLRNIVALAGPFLGSTGRVYAISYDGYEIGAPLPLASNKPDNAGIRAALAEKTNGNAQYRTPTGGEVFGVYHWMNGMELALLVEQNTTEAFAPITRLTNIMLGLTLLTLLISGGLILIFVRRLTRPIQQLTDTAQLLASGNLNLTVNIAREDELGLLGEAFNRMAAQLNDVYAGLEDKVAERTRQLAAAAEVARIATATLRPEELLTRIVELIRERFGYYQISIFLMDDAGEYAVLREATGPVGARLKAEGYQLAVGAHSLVGWVAAHKQSRIVRDVSTDTTYLKNELLPETRAEAVLPLRSGERLIGVLDIQSQDPEAFSEAETQVLQILADQIAVSVENGRLFTRQSQVIRLEQLLTSLIGQIHQSRQLDTILEVTATSLGRTLGAQRAVVRLTGERLTGIPTPIEAPAPSASLAETPTPIVEPPAPSNGQPAAPSRRRVLPGNLLDKL